MDVAGQRHSDCEMSFFVCLRSRRNTDLIRDFEYPFFEFQLDLILHFASALHRRIEKSEWLRVNLSVSSTRSFRSPLDRVDSEKKQLIKKKSKKI